MIKHRWKKPRLANVLFAGARHITNLSNILTKTKLKANVSCVIVFNTRSLNVYDVLSLIKFTT